MRRPAATQSFAWEDVELGAWFDADYMQNYEGRGLPVTIATATRKPSKSTSFHTCHDEDYENHSSVGCRRRDGAGRNAAGTARFRIHPRNVRRSDSRGPLAAPPVEMRRVDGTPPQTIPQRPMGAEHLLCSISDPANTSFSHRATDSFLGIWSWAARRRRCFHQSRRRPVCGRYRNDVDNFRSYSGRIRDKDGDPVGAAAVQALVPVYQDGQRVLKPAGGVYE